MNAFLVEDTFAGTADAQVTSRAPTTSDLGSDWTAATPASWVLKAGPQALNSASLNTANLNLDALDLSGAFGDPDVIDTLSVSVTLNIAGATPFGGTYGGPQVFLNDGFNRLNVQLILDGGVVKASWHAGSQSGITSLATLSEYTIELEFSAATVTAKVNGTTMGTATESNAFSPNGGNALVLLNMNGSGTVWKDFSASGSYTPSGPPPVADPFWTDLIAAREVP